jgi:protein required for attachment to host cells
MMKNMTNGHRGIGLNAWVAACDGRKALLLQNAGDATYPKLETRETFEHKVERTSALGTSPEGRVFSSADSTRRGAPEPTDLHRREEEAFVKTFAERLDRYALEGKIKELIVAAPSRALGVLRGSMGHAARFVEAEFAKDFVDMPVYEIERHLLQLLAARK